MNIQNQENNSTEINFEEEVMKLKDECGGWKELYLKLTEKSISKSGSKMEKSVEIYKEMIGKEGVRRIDIINAMINQQGISKDCASTYFQTIRTRLKSTGQ